MRKKPLLGRSGQKFPTHTVISPAKIEPISNPLSFLSFFWDWKRVEGWPDGCGFAFIFLLLGIEQPQVSFFSQLTAKPKDITQRGGGNEVSHKIKEKKREDKKDCFLTASEL